MTRFNLRVWIVVAASVAVCAAASACGSAASQQTSANATSTNPTLAHAISIVKQYSQPQPIPQVPPLTRRPPAGKTVDWVFCTLPICEQNAAQPAFAKLGWRFNLVPFDITQGPQAEVAALQKAIQNHPDYIGFANVFPTTIFAKQLAQLKRMHIPVVALTGQSSPYFAGCVDCERGPLFLGRLMADTIIADARGKTTILYVNDDTIAASTAGEKAAKQLVDNSGLGITFDELNVPSSASPSADAQAIVSYIQSHPDVRYVASGLNNLIDGLPPALSTTGLTNIKLAEINPDDTDRKYVAHGQMWALIQGENDTTHWRAADMLTRLSVGQPIPSALNDALGWAEIFTKKNVTVQQAQPPHYQQTFFAAWHL